MKNISGSMSENGFDVEAENGFDVLVESPN
jgi:hypothetical protein